jgi:ethanolaminephosphotransferase
MICVPFFLNTLEEFYTGELNLPILNGVSEGTVMACIAMCTSGFMGVDWWFNEITIFGFTTQYNFALVTACFFSGLGFGLASLFNILKNFREKKEEVIKNIQMFVYLIAAMLLVIFYSDSEIVKNYPKLIIILFGFAFAKLVGHLQLCHIADTKFYQYRKSLMISFFFLSIFSVKNSFNEAISINIDNIILIFLGMHMFCWAHLAYFVTEEMCMILGIYRFNVKRRPIKVGS